MKRSVEFFSGEIFYYYYFSISIVSGKAVGEGRELLEKIRRALSEAAEKSGKRVDKPYYSVAGPR